MSETAQGAAQDTGVASGAAAAVKGMPKWLKRLLIAIAALIIICVGAFAIYVNIYYHADSAAELAMKDEDIYAYDQVYVMKEGDNYAFVPGNAVNGLIFYPGGKVQAEAYAPLMQNLARRGVLCVLCPMPFNLAPFGTNAADGIRDLYPQVQNWYIGGHSLGGVVAADYAKAHADQFKGVVLLGSYTTANLSDTDLKALCIYGSNDKVMNMKSFEANESNLPEDAETVVIEGGNHAQFGSYGKQDGDGEATMKDDHQQDEAARIIVDWMTE